MKNIKIGDFYSEEILIDKNCINRFAEVSGDFSPIHTDEAYAKQTRFGGCIAHGMLLAAYISRVIGMKLPGRGTIYVSQNLKFCAPVYVNMRVRINVVVKDVNVKKNRVTLITTCTDLEKTILLEGEAVVIPPDE